MMPPRTRNQILAICGLSLLVFIKYLQVHFPQPSMTEEDYTRQIDDQLRNDTGQMGEQK